MQHVRCAHCQSIRIINGRNTSREVKKAFRIAWLNVVHHLEDEASSESDKKVEWYSDRHDNLTDDVRMAENKASTERDHCQKADEKLAQACYEFILIFNGRLPK